jgi:hypothetical protein
MVSGGRLGRHTSAMTLPTRQDINVHDSLDEPSAGEHFLGKSMEEAEALFRESSPFHQEDLMFTGASAFRFYWVLQQSLRQPSTNIPVRQPLVTQTRHDQLLWRSP